MYFSKNSYVYKNTFVRDFTGNIPDEKVIFIPHEKKEPVGMVIGDFTNVGTKWVRTGTDYLDKDVYFVIEYGAHLNDSLPTTPIVYKGSFIAPQEQQANNIEVINYSEIVEEQNNNLLISVPETNFLLGDVDGDGIITSNDANLIQQYIVGNINLTPAQLQRADVDGDGVVSAYDASLILQIAEADNISPVIIDPEPVIPDPYTPPVIPDPENGIDVRYLTIEQLNNFPTNDLKKYFINNNEYTISSITLEEDLVTVKIISNAYYVYRFYDQVLLHVYNYDPFAQLNFYNYTPPVVPDPYTPPVVPDPYTPPVVPDPYTPPVVPDPYTPPVVPDPILSNKKAVLAVALLAAVFIMSN